MEDIKIKFGRRFKDLRLVNGYSQEKLAELSDLERTYIPGIEAGKKKCFTNGCRKNGKRL